DRPGALPLAGFFVFRAWIPAFAGMTKGRGAADGGRGVAKDSAPSAVSLNRHGGRAGRTSERFLLVPSVPRNPRQEAQWPPSPVQASAPASTYTPWSASWWLPSAMA